MKPYDAICSEVVIFWCYSLLYNIIKVLSRFGYTRSARIPWEVSELDKFLPTLMIDLSCMANLANRFVCMQFVHSASKPCSGKKPCSEVSRELANNQTDKKPWSRGVWWGKLSCCSSRDMQSLSVLLTHLSSLVGYHVLVQSLPDWYRLYQWLVLSWMQFLRKVIGQGDKLPVQPMWPG